jgi:hypothetical protein
MVSFLESLIEVDCGENRRPLCEVAESRWILLANIFSAWSSDWRGVGEIEGYRIARENLAGGKQCNTTYTSAAAKTA